MYLNEIDIQNKSPKLVLEFYLLIVHEVKGKKTSRDRTGDALNDVDRALVSSGNRRASAKSSKVISGVQ